MADFFTGAFIAQATNFTMKFDYDGSGNQTYLGWTQPGSLTSDASWRIMKQTFNGSNQLTDVSWANGSTGFGAVWDSRASYSYF